MAYTFSDVLIKPKYSNIKSRRDVDTGVYVGPFHLKVPILSANMKTITGSIMAEAMTKSGGLAFLHRFNTTQDAVEEFKTANQACAVSIGVQDSDKNRFQKLYEAGARVFCIDVAHGHHSLVKKMATWLQHQGYVCDGEGSIFLVIGNIATPEAAIDLIEWGASAIKVGVGPGSVCHTRRNTGVGIPQLYALDTIYTALKERHLDCHIISDGGITCVGDICKALKFADSVMVGSYLAGTDETPGSRYKSKNGQYYKVYMGSASSENKISSGETSEYIEGVATEVPLKGPVQDIMKEISDGIQSSCSYVGANNLQKFKELCEFVFISDGAKKESKL